MAAQNNARSAWLPICFRWSFVILLFLTMVVPNSIKPVSVSFLALTAALGWPCARRVSGTCASCR